MKLCKDCKWCRPANGIVSWFGLTREKWKYAKCTNPKTDGSGKVDVVDGHQKPAPPSYCKVNRGYNISCGQEAKYFEPKNPQKIIRSSLLDCYAGEHEGEPALMKGGEPMCWGEDLWLNNRDKTPTEAAQIFLERLRCVDVRVTKGTIV